MLRRNVKIQFGGAKDNPNKFLNGKTAAAGFSGPFAANIGGRNRGELEESRCAGRQPVSGNAQQIPAAPEMLLAALAPDSAGARLRWRPTLSGAAYSGDPVAEEKFLTARATESPE